MVDITAVFKACIETLRQQNKEFSSISHQDHTHTSPSTQGPKSTIFPRKKSEYITKARELASTITTLRDFLEENRNAYLNIGAATLMTLNHRSVFATPLTNKSSLNPKPTMTDLERDQIDSDVQKIVQTCQKRIFEYQTLLETTDSIRSNQFLYTHLESIAASLSKYLKEVTGTYSEMRAIRVKRTVDYKAMSRLSSSKSSKSTAPATPAGSKFKANLEAKGREKTPSGGDKRGVPESDEADGPSSSSSVPAYFLDDEIPPEELQILEEENAALLNELNSLANEVDEIQSNVVQIAQLQEIFTEKVLQQEREIDKIANVVVGTTENIKGGNEQIRQAIQKNADFRVWVLFFILVMSFSLLFLDWYND